MYRSLKEKPGARAGRALASVAGRCAMGDQKCGPSVENLYLRSYNSAFLKLKQAAPICRTDDKTMNIEDKNTDIALGNQTLHYAKDSLLAGKKAAFQTLGCNFYFAKTYFLR